MFWNHKKVYDTLVEKNNHKEFAKENKLICLDYPCPKQGERSIVLYKYNSSTQYLNSPLHVKEKRDTFSKKIFDRLAPAIKWKRKSDKDWDYYRTPRFLIDDGKGGM